jgi:hypothetical protein
MANVIARVLAVAVLLLSAAAALAEEPAPPLRALLAKYHCPVVDRLEQIYRAADSSDPQNWFLIVSFAANPHDYVQCVFDTKTRMLCETASGFYDDAATTPRKRWLPRNAVATLGRLGYSTNDSAGNFRIWFDVAKPPDFDAIARVVLKSLFAGFGAQADDDLKFEAPLAPHALKSCVPIS